MSEVMFADMTNEMVEPYTSVGHSQAAHEGNLNLSHGTLI